MPYAQLHYPFENKELFERTHPADFVSEGIDQTRGWFYTLLVLSTHLFGAAPWKNLIVTGLVLAAYVLCFAYSPQLTICPVMARK
jgi:isoleucyl-tRNA synthetase